MKPLVALITKQARQLSKGDTLSRQKFLYFLSCHNLL